MRAELMAMFLGVAALAAQTDSVPPQPAPHTFLVSQGTRIPLSLINSISTRQAAEGDRVYLETAFPILSGGRVVIPPGSYVAGTVTSVKKPGKVKGRGELYLRFDSLTLPNGVTRDFKARVGGLEGGSGDELDRAEGKIRSDGNKAGDSRNVAEATVAGASAGAIAGNVAGHAGMGAGIGAAAGATAGLIGVLLSRGPDAVLAKGTTLEMILDRPLQFTDSELDFGPMAPRRPIATTPAPQQRSKGGGLILPGRRAWPL